MISDSKMAQLRREKNGIYHQCGRDFSRENFPENLYPLYGVDPAKEKATRVVHKWLIMICLKRLRVAAFSAVFWFI